MLNVLLGFSLAALLMGYYVRHINRGHIRTLKGITSGLGEPDENGNVGWVCR